MLLSTKTVVEVDLGSRIPGLAEVALYPRSLLYMCGSRAA